MKRKEWKEIVEAAETYEELSDPELRDCILERMDEVRYALMFGILYWLISSIATIIGWWDVNHGVIAMGFSVILMVTGVFVHSECVNDVTFLEEKKIYSLLDELWEEPYVATDEEPGPEIA